MQNTDLRIVGFLALAVGGMSFLPVATAAADACPLVSSDNWRAWINAMPSPSGPTLIVTGSITLPSAGYSAKLEPGPLDRSARPVQQVRLIIEPPGAMSAQALTTQEVRLDMPSRRVPFGKSAPYRGVRVICGGRQLAFVAPEVAW